MSSANLTSIFQKSPYFDKVLAGLKEYKGPQTICGLCGSAKALFIATVYVSGYFPILVVTQNEDEKDRMCEDLSIFLNTLERHKVDILPFSSLDPNSRLITLYKLTSGNPYLIIVADIETLSLKLPSFDDFLKLSQNIAVGSIVKYGNVIDKLINSGYERLNIVESKGQFSVRGEIIDVWPADQDEPIRIEFLQDKVESLRQFDHISQRAKKELEQIHIIPFNPKLINNSCLYDWFLTGGLIISDNVAIVSNAKYLSFVPFEDTRAISFFTKPMENFHRQISLLSNKIRQYFDNDFQVILVCDNEGQRERMKELIEPYLLEFKPRFPIIVVGNLSSGFESTSLKIAIIGDEEIFGRYHFRRYLAKKKFTHQLPDSVFFELVIGDYVVHEIYGIGVYEGITRLKIQTQQQDFFVIKYAEEDKLYVPMDQLSLVHKYIGIQGYKPRIYRLGGNSWDRVKKRVKESIQDMAKELIELSAVRNTMSGYMFSEDSHLQKEFDAAFIYEETQDQQRAIEEVKSDMESKLPMDRIICGDVGYGKTEVAMRAAFKAVMDSKQVALLVPTTILAEQHFNTFCERFADYPVNIEMLSRFKTKKEQVKIISDLKRGLIDIIIGTHRLVQKDVQFKDLGLIIIDEEQRFGVRHKEKLKQLRKLADVLTLTATPIPRTLHMGLAGIRNMSIINDPPEGRLPISTYIMEYNEKVIKDAILKELGRRGQVFFVHNRVNSIDKIAEELAKIVSEAKIAMAHGQMPEKDLETVMLKFIKEDFNVLVATSIIESGLDIPNVNTLIIKDVQDFGLAQLYQLRGRIGRGKNKAYAYLFYTPQNVEPLSLQAIKRLQTIQEFTEPGSGFKIAMRDLEIRGAGNILGHQQSGHIMEIGFNLYCKLLSETVNELKGEVIKSPVITSIYLDIPAFLPVTYIGDNQQRVNIYKKMAAISNEEELNEIGKELIDRFGKYPQEVKLLLDIIDLRLMAQKINILKISQDIQQIKIEFDRNVDFPIDRFIKLTNIKEYKNRIRFEEGNNFNMTITEIPKFHQDLIAFIKKILQRLT